MTYLILSIALSSASQVTDPHIVIQPPSDYPVQEKWTGRKEIYRIPGMPPPEPSPPPIPPTAPDLWPPGVKYPPERWDSDEVLDWLEEALGGRPRRRIFL